MSTFIIFILVLSLLVFVHEFGHFWTARKLGVRAEEFGFGLPPRIWGIYKSTRGKWRQVWGSKEVRDAEETVYSLNWIPIGGFVKIKGEDGAERVDSDSFSSRPIWQRFSIISAGVLMNIFLAAVLISIGFVFGFPQVLDGVDDNARISEKKIQITQVLPESPADSAELKTADVILAINGQNFENEAQIQNFVADKNGEQLTYKIKRGDKILEKEITPEIIEGTDRAGVGIGIALTGLVSYPWYLAIFKGFQATFFLLLNIILAFFFLFKKLLTGGGVGGDVAGPVGIAGLTGQMAEMGYLYLVQFTAMLSLNLAVLNFLPFPALDGGKALFLLIEKIKGSPVKRNVENAIHGAGMIILLLLILLVTFKDISNFF